MEEDKKEKVEKVKKGFRIVGTIFNVVLAILGLAASAAIIYVFVKSGMAIRDAWIQIFG